MKNIFTLKELETLDHLCSTDPIFYIDHPAFHRDEGHIHRIGHRLFNKQQLVFDKSAADANWNTWLAARYFDDMSSLPKQSDIPLFIKEDEILAFIRLNFAKWRINRLQKYGKSRRLTLQQKQVILHWHAQYLHTRDTIGVANLGLVVSGVRRFRKPAGWEYKGAIDIGDVISEGNTALLYIAEKFNVNLGWKFSTYALTSIFRTIYKVMQKDLKRPVTLLLDTPINHRSDMTLQDVLPDSKRKDLDKGLLIQELHRILDGEINHRTEPLTDRELLVIQQYYQVGCENGTTPTLKRNAKMLGLTRERIRQIKNRALYKMKGILSGEFLVECV